MNYLDNPVSNLHTALAHAMYEGFPAVDYEGRDWVEIDPLLVEQNLVKQNLEHWLEMCRLQDCRDRKDWEYQMPAEEVAQLTKSYSKLIKWEINPYITLEDVKAKRYSTKKVLIMQSKRKGVKTFDRFGDIEY